MKTIVGKFVTTHNGKPAAFGNLKLELLRESVDSQDGGEQDIVPLGELAETLAVPIDAEHLREWREWQKELGRTDEEIAADEAIEFKQTYNLPNAYNFTLDEHGCPPRGAEVVGSDEISGTPEYRVTVHATAHSCGGYNTKCFDHTLRIAGDSPIDLNEIVPPKPKFDPDAHLTPRERELKAADAAIVRDGSLKFGRKNRIGFFAGIDYPKSNASSAPLPSLERGEFGVFPFTLASAALVNRVSIIVDRAGKTNAAIGIYDAGGTKRADVLIDLSRPGMATGFFPSELDLNAGDHFLAWGTERLSDAELRIIGTADALNLLNASGVPLMGSGRTQTGALPETLGRIIPSAPSKEYRPGSLYGPTFAPILAYFKA